MNDPLNVPTLGSGKVYLQSVQMPDRSKFAKAIQEYHKYSSPVIEQLVLLEMAQPTTLIYTPRNDLIAREVKWREKDKELYDQLVEYLTSLRLSIFGHIVPR